MAEMIITKIKPMFTTVIVTQEKYSRDEVPSSVILDTKKMAGAVKEHQTVIAVGDSVRGVKVGDIVKVNPMRYAVWKDKRKNTNSVVNNLEEYHNEIVGFNIPTVELDGKEYMKLQENDIEYVVEDYRMEEVESPLIHPASPRVILP